MSQDHDYRFLVPIDVIIFASSNGKNDMPHSQNSSFEKGPQRIEELICFALYSANHAMNRAYGPHLSELGLTYPQYITLTALWDEDGVSVGSLCDRLMTETNTLTPVLKRLEAQGHIERRRGDRDERMVFIHLTKSGRALKLKAPHITACIIDNTGLPLDRLEELVSTIATMRGNLNRNRVRSV